MPRIRSIKPEMFGDEKLAPLSVLDRFVFVGLISMADDAGRLLDSVRAIDGFVFPLTEDTSKKSLDRLAAAGVIVRYQSGSGQRLIQLAGWKKHQRIEKPNPHTLPGPSVTEAPTVGEDSGNVPGMIVERVGEQSVPASAIIHPPDLRSTINDLGSTINDPLSAAGAAASVTAERATGGHGDPPGFDAVWAAYPPRAGDNPRRRAAQAYRARIKGGATPAQMLAGVERYRAYCVAMGRVGTEFVQQAVRFFGPDRGFALPWSVPAGASGAPDEVEVLVASLHAQEDDNAAWLAARRSPNGAVKVPA